MSTHALTLNLDDGPIIQPVLKEGDNVIVTSSEGIKIVATVAGHKIVAWYASLPDGSKGTVTTIRMAEHDPRQGELYRRKLVCFVCSDTDTGSRRCYRVDCDTFERMQF